MASSASGATSGSSPEYTDFVNRLGEAKHTIDSSAAALPSDTETKSKSVADPIMKNAGSPETAETKEGASPTAKKLSDVKNSVKELAASTKQIYSQLKKMEGKPGHAESYKSGWQTLQTQKKALDSSKFDESKITDPEDKKTLKEIQKEIAQINKTFNKAQKAFDYETGTKMSTWTQIKQFVGLKASEGSMRLRSEAFKGLAITEQKITFRNGGECNILEQLQKAFGEKLKNRDFKDGIASFVANDNFAAMVDLIKELSASEKIPLNPGQTALLRLGSVNLNQRINWTATVTAAHPGRTGLDSAVISMDYLMAKAWEAAGQNPDAFKDFKPSDLKKIVDQEPIKGKFFTEVLQAAAWHHGDSDSTGAIVMLVLGQALGESWIPEQIAQEAKTNVYR